jgi:hypothetical protein
VLAFLSLLLAVVVAGELWYFYNHDAARPQEPPPPDSEDIPSPVLPRSEELTLPPLDSYDLVGERPLFVEGRRPPAEEPEEEEEPVVEETPPPELTLMGVYMTPEGATALVRNEETKEVLRRRTGEDIAGWQVASIEADRLVVSQGENEEVLPLRDYTRPAPPPGKPARQRRSSRRTANPFDRRTRSATPPRK